MVDDAIVMLENIVRRRIREPPLVAAYKEQSKLNVATTVVLVVVVPLIFIKG